MNLSKKVVITLFSAAASIGVQAQAKKPVSSAASKPAASAVVLKNTQDSLSYAIGLSVANFYKQQNITNINTALVTRAINDVNKNAASKSYKLLLDEQQANNCIVNYMQKAKAEKSSGNRKAGEQFLAANKTKPGVVTLPSGLQYQVIKEGKGAKPLPTDKVKVHYHGTLIDGRVFDSSVDRGEPIELSVNGVISGWTEALQLMPVGSKWKLFIPSNLAYGDQQAGPLITPGSTLIFDVELLDIIKDAAPAAKPDSTQQ